MTYIVINFLYTMQIVLLCVAGLEMNYYLFIWTTYSNHRGRYKKEQVKFPLKGGFSHFQQKKIGVENTFHTILQCLAIILDCVKISFCGIISICVVSVTAMLNPSKTNLQFAKTLILTFATQYSTYIKFQSLLCL